MDKILVNSSIDIIILVIIGIMMYIGYKKGVIRALFDLLSFVITGILTYSIYPMVVKIVANNTNIYIDFSKAISEKFDLNVIANQALEKEDQINLIKDLNIPIQFKQILIENNNSEVFDFLNVKNFQEYIGTAISTIIINVVIVIILFLVINIVLSILIKWFDVFNKIPFIRFVNKMAGIIFGFIQGSLIVCVMLMVISIFFASDPQNHFLMKLINESYIGSFFYKNNPLMDFITIV